MSKPWFIHRLVGIALLALLTSAHAEIEREWPDAGLQITTDQAVLRASDGQIIVPAGRYESIRPLGSVALVSRQERHGLINALGRPVTPLRYSYIERILRRGAHAWFAVSVEGPSGSLRAGIIDETGRTLVEPAWESIDLLQRPQDDDAAGDPPSQALFKIQRGGRIGAVNLAGRITIAPQFSHMAQLSGQGTMVLLEQGSRQALCDAATGACPFALGQQRLQPLVPDRADDQLLLVGQPGKLGLFDLHLNGQRVGDAYFQPGWSDYAKRAYSRALDVTALVQSGRNALGAVVADGWYAGYIGFGRLNKLGPNGLGRYFYGKTPALLVQLELTYADGSHETVLSDPSWRVTDAGPIREADLLMGEAHDARR
ncbi:MAG TPA: alpha-L-rhamnosidase N-terminal domain-containing protein, partial [Aquabacterium sp.]|nr:alpha-L-rhamnosidase N-terminal domain-containing protein [Aquabacterium sp.]